MKYVDLYKNHTDLTENEKVMYGYISEMDSVVGDVIASLKDMGEYDHTLIVFSSDNGAPNVKEVRGRNWPLRGFKTSIWEGGMKVPGFVSGGVLPQPVRGSVSHELYHVTDWLPSLLHVAGGNLDAVKAGTFDGHNVWESISTGTASPRTEMVYNVNSLCDSGQAGPPKAGMRMVVNGVNWKVLSFCYQISGIGENVTTTGPTTPESFPPKNWPKTFGSVMLFNLDTDPSEDNDVAKENPIVLKTLLKRLKYHALQSVEPMQWFAPYQGKDYECASCPLRSSVNNPNVPWTPWI